MVINKHTVIEDYKEPISFSCADSTALVKCPWYISRAALHNKSNCFEDGWCQASEDRQWNFETSHGYSCRSNCLHPSCLWEEWIDSIEDGKTYVFTNMRVREDSYTNEKYVNTAKSGCKIEMTTPFTEALPDVAMSLSDIATKEVTISVVGVKALSNFFTCQSCSKKLEECGTKYICRPCNMKQKPINTQWYCKLRVQDTSSRQFNLSVFHPQLIKLLQTQGKYSLATLTKDQIEDIPLDAGGLQVSMNVQQGKLLDILQ